MTGGEFLSLILGGLIVLVFAGLLLGLLGMILSRLKLPLRASEHLPLYLGIMGLAILILHYFGPRWGVVLQPRLVPLAMPAAIIALGVFVARAMICLKTRCWD
ncbi:MAG: hypothetical protein GY835_15145 [bacterium]|nr:hypothetical protein [bacterium]